MKIQRSGWMAIAAAAVSAAVWLHPGLRHGTATLPHSTAIPIAAGDVAALLDQVQIVDQIPQVDGYDRGRRKGRLRAGMERPHRPQRLRHANILRKPATTFSIVIWSTRRMYQSQDAPTQ